jgi:hypothetical protein
VTDSEFSAARSPFRMRPSVVTSTYSENWGSTRRLGSRMS